MKTPMRKVCAKCGYSWETNRMIDNERYCPKCGGSAPASGEEECM